MPSGKISEIELECPFCKKSKIKITHKEGFFQSRKTWISNKSKTKKYYIPDSYEILENCPNCGAKKRDIKNALEGTTERTHEEKIERLKKRGLSLIIRSK